MIKYAHVGFAKTGSTWLQDELFPRHEEMYHLGRFHGDQIIDDDLRLFLWRDIVDTPKFLWDAQYIQNCFDKHINTASQAGKKALGISHEGFTSPITGNLDVVERAERLCEAIGSDTKIIIIIRDQLSWIKSIYAGLLQEGGMPLTFEQFLFYFYYDQDRSPFSSLFYDKIFELYADLFGIGNVTIIPFEMVKNNPLGFIQKICDAIGVSKINDISLTPKNAQPTNEAMNYMLSFNKKNRFFMGGNHLERPWGHCVAPLYEKLFNTTIPTKIIDDKTKSHFTLLKLSNFLHSKKTMNLIPPDLLYEIQYKSKLNILKIHKIIKYSFQQSQLHNKINLDYPDHYLQLLKKAYTPHNNRLEKLAGIDLTQFNYLSS